MYSYVSFLSGRLRVEPVQPICPIMDRPKHHSTSYADQRKYSKLKPEDIPQPEGRVMTDRDWERIV